MSSPPHVPAEGRIRAILGPTNTGKTHFAVERLLGHHSAVIGLPLRLLAREVYDRVVAVKGARAVALVTGEEKIVPDHASHFVCTVESMPTGREFDFLAVDEIQLCADPERGHVFTDRLLRARGRYETLFMGSDSMRPLIRRLVPQAEFIARPRLSSLSYAGPKKLSRLPRRSAVVAFSAADVYAVAELIRRQRGGAAVVMGALSPRTRNAQVAMYQAGEVDFIVATDAIGMGLNMAVDHVAFASLRKFDGIAPRQLTAAEIGQIAGRAGRHLNDGSFGVTADVPPLAPDLVEQLETHQVPRLKSLSWRNADLAFTGLDALLRSLEAPPPAAILTRPREASDQMALRALARSADIRDLARGAAAVRLLWQICQIPDFRKTMPDAHARLLGRIFVQLMGAKGVLDTDWVAGHVAALDRTDGDIDTLATRIAHTRTWTFVSHRHDWLDDAGAWQERTRRIEDRLSDALHERLTQRFVDRRTAVLLRRLRDHEALAASIGEDGDVMVEGQFIGHIHGLRFRPDGAARGAEGRAFRRAAKQSMAWELTRRAQNLAKVPKSAPKSEPKSEPKSNADTALTLDHRARIQWHGEAVAQLERGDSPFRPRLNLLADDLIPQALRDRVAARLRAWLEGHIARVMAPLARLAACGNLSGPARGLAFQLSEALGTAPRQVVEMQIRLLGRDDRRRLRHAGVRLGQESVYLPGLLKPEPARLALLLWAVNTRRVAGLPAPPAPGLVSVAADPDLPVSYYHAVGFRRFGPRAIRADMVERLADALHERAANGTVTSSPELLSIIGCPRDDFPAVMAALGYRHEIRDGERHYRRRRAAARPGPPRRSRRPRQPSRADDTSPFTVLRQLSPDQAER